MASPEVTILIPNYRTPQITTLCLRLLRKHTDGDRIHVIVIDNNSRDASVEYLRTLRWIQLIERVPATNESGPLSHARALDEGLSRVMTPYVLALHTDTLIRRPGWLDVLLQPLEANLDIAGVGSWKLDQNTTIIKRFGKNLKMGLSGMFRHSGRNLFGCEEPSNSDRYLRSHCAVYRTDLLIRHNLHFSERGDVMPAGKMIHRALTAQGYHMAFLSPDILSRYLCHLEHATMVLNPELGASKRTVSRGLARITRLLNELNEDTILNDVTLDE